MNRNLTEFLSGMTFAPPARGKTVELIEEKIGARLPEQYRAFLLESDGAEGFTGADGYLYLWPAKTVLDLNGGSGMVFFGADGRGTAFAFDYSRGGVVTAVKFGSMRFESGIVCAESFYEFLIRQGSSLPDCRAAR